MHTLTRNLFGLRFGVRLVVMLPYLACVTSLHADTMTIEGSINQSTEDGTGPAVNNPSLNNIPDGAAFSVQLTFDQSITAPGTYALTGSSLVFRVAAAGAVEDSFSGVSLTVARSGSFDQVSLFACVASGSGCNQGNELDLSLMIPFANLNDQNIAGQGIPGLLPLDLLEDDGVTDLHGVITNYSYTPAGSVPEPSAFVLLASCLIAVALKWRRVRRVERSLDATRTSACATY